MNTLYTIQKSVSNFLGFSTPRKIVVFEVDDWGAKVIDSEDAYKAFIGKGLIDSENRFNKFDSLASIADLEALFEVLQSAKDKFNRPAVFTAVTTVANPDFEKIDRSTTGEYFYEYFTKTLKKTFSGDVIGTWKRGMDAGIFVPQFHGREHINVSAFRKILEKETTLAKLILQTASLPILKKQAVDYLKSFDYQKEEELKEHRLILETGVKLFEEIFNQYPLHFTPPGLIYSSRLDDTLHYLGIQYIDVAKTRLEPVGVGRFKKQFNWLGKQNKNGQRYMTRNARFEPSINHNYDWVGQCMKDLSISFFWKKPAIISSHRVNFVSSRSIKNRDLSLKMLNTLLIRIKKQWPEVEFMSISQLGAYMDSAKNEY